jgi:hypothetical protein
MSEIWIVVLNIFSILCNININQAFFLSNSSIRYEVKTLTYKGSKASSLSTSSVNVTGPTGPPATLGEGKEVNIGVSGKPDLAQEFVIDSGFPKVEARYESY